MLFFNSKITISQDNKSISTRITRDTTKNFSMFAQNDNQRAVASALEAQGGELFIDLLGSDEKTFRSTLDTLDNDFFLNAQNTAILNTMDVTKSVKDQALRRGDGSTAELAHGVTLWATGLGNWGSSENTSKVDSDFYAGLVGVDKQFFGNTTLGVFFGAGTTDFDGNQDGSMDSDDIHFGFYGNTNFNDVALISYGVVRTEQDREGSRKVTLGSADGFTAFNSDSDITEFYVEGAYTGFKLANAEVQPYLGFSYIKASSDGITEKAGKMTMSTTVEDQSLQVASLGVRGEIPFSAGSIQMAMKGDIAWKHFFGDTEAQAVLGGVAAGTIKGAELSDLFSIGLGIEAKVGQQTTIGISYTGNFDSDVESNGVSANIRYAF